MRYQNKNGNKKIVVDGIKFDSVKEAHRYKDLKLQERAGLIKDLRLQVKYTLIPAQYEEVTENGKTKQKCVERECTYTADFEYYRNGEKVVEDVKGYRDPASSSYARYTIKRKLMLHIHGIKIREV